MRKVLYILGELTDDDLGWLIDAGVTRRVKPKTAIIEQGVALDTLYIVLEGELSVRIGGAGGREVARLGAGEVVGDMSLLDSRPPNATVTAVDPTTLYCVAQTALQTKLRRDVGFAARFYRALCLFLANRLSATTLSAGEGSGEAAREAEIAPDLLESVSLAGARFSMFVEKMLKR